MLNFLIALDQSGFKADETIKDTQSKMLQGCFVDLQQTPNITIQEATTMLHDVKAAGIPDWMREEVAKAVQNKVAATAEEPASPKLHDGGGLEHPAEQQAQFLNEDAMPLQKVQLSEADLSIRENQSSRSLHRALGLPPGATRNADA